MHAVASELAYAAVSSGFPPLQKRVLRLWLAAQRRKCSSDANGTEAKLLELCASENWSPNGSDGEEEGEEEMDNSEPLDDSDVVLSDSGWPVPFFLWFFFTYIPCSGSQLGLLTPCIVSRRRPRGI